MTNLKVFLKLFWKRKWSILLYIIIFIIIGIIFSQSQKNEVLKKSRLLVVDQDSSKRSNLLTEFLEDQFHVTVRKDAEVEEELYLYRFQAALIIKKDFLKKTDRLEIVTRDEKLKKLLDFKLNAFYTYADAVEGPESTKVLKEVLKQKIDVDFLKKENISAEQNIAAYFQVAGYVILGILLMVNGEVIQSLMSKNILLRRSVAKDNDRKQNFEIILSEWLCGFFIWILIVVVGFAFYQRFNMIFIKYSLQTMATLLWIIPMANMLANIARNRNVINMLSNTVSLVFAFIGGAFVPLEIMSDTALKIAKFTPLYYHTISMEKVFEGKSTWQEWAIQFLFGLFFFEVTMIYRRVAKSKICF